MEEEEERGLEDIDRRSGNKGAEREDRVGIGRTGMDKRTTGNENRLERQSRDMRQGGSWES